MGIFNKIKKKITEDKPGEKEVKKKDKVLEKSKEEKVEKVKKVKPKKEAKKEDKKKQSKKTKTNKEEKIAYNVLVKPLITEKVTELGALNKYAFEISLKSNKTEVKKAINEVYGVTPISVNIVNMKGKKVRSGRSIGRKKDWEKAIITLNKGEKIEVYEGV